MKIGEKKKESDLDINLFYGFKIEYSINNNSIFAQKQTNTKCAPRLCHRKHVKI